jgi:hypothetical protein
MDRMELEEIERRSSGYWNIDGLPELVMGALWVVWGGLWLIGTTLPRGSMAFTCFWLVVPPVLACTGFFGDRTLRRLKERITLPRAGYARLKQPPAWAKVIVALVIALVILAVVFAPVGHTESTLPPLVLALVSVGMLREGARARNGRLLILAVISLGLGVWVWRTGAGWIGLNWAFLWLGAAALVTGVLRLRRFLRENPKVVETEA